MDDSKDCCEPSNICEGNSRPEYPNTELYVGTKIVKGVPMTETDFYKNIKNKTFQTVKLMAMAIWLRMKMVMLAGRQKKYLSNAIGYFPTKKSIWLKMSYCKCFGFV